jgi:hypothetical protein
MKRSAALALVVLIAGLGLVATRLIEVGAADSASELGDLTAVAAALGVNPASDGKYTAAAIFDTLATRLAAVEQAPSVRNQDAELAVQVAALERSIATDYAARIESLERDLSDLKAELQHLGGSASLMQFVFELEKGIRDLQCRASDCSP